MIARGDGRQHPAASPGLLTDLYHPDAMYVAWRAGQRGLATFDLYVRRAPFGGAFLLAAGVGPALEFVRAFRYEPADLDYLARIRPYPPEFLEYLSRLRFTGDVAAVREGEVVFPDEPILRVTGPFPEALALESGLLQTINLATLIATKAARVVYAAQGRRVAEFALRRAQDPLVTARSAYVGGCHSTSFLGAAAQLGLTATGSIPHALVQVFDDEESAFAAVAETYREYTLLLDTYDVPRALATAIRVAKRSAAALGHRLVAVRIDSGDLVAETQRARRALDAAGLTDVRILISNELDEWAIAELLAAGAVFDAVGVGTRLGVGAGSARHQVEGGFLGGVYKLAHYVTPTGAAVPKLKVAGEKSTWPGVKEVYRIGQYERDVVALAEEAPPAGGRSLLRAAVRGGELLPDALPPLPAVREHAQESLRALPARWRALRVAEEYPVECSAALARLRAALIPSPR